MIVAIDGPAAAGKGTLARRIAEALGYHHLDTGLLYRAVGVLTVQRGQTPKEAAESLVPEDLKRPDLRGEAAGQAASKVAAIPEVRAALLDFQRRFASLPPGAVLDGRDIGTVICPDAQVKLFVTASVEKRAERRVKELLAKGESVIAGRVLQDLKDRDARDSARDVAPMTTAPDAILLDTSDLDADAAFEAALAIVRRKM
ncbi:MAG TPA: d(CMP) kinase [Magnetospirillaceae bacterium]|nr:d(CMP) kinase [Magnetospirillaceae bacterium]